MSIAIELVVWDMDGTLINSASVVPDAFIATAEKFGKPGYTRQNVIDLYGLGVPENVVAHMLEKPVSKETMNFFYDQLQQNSSHVSTYAEIPKCLSHIHARAKQAVFTGASQRSAEILLKAVGIDQHFDLILGGDDYLPKPDPGALVALAAQFDVAQKNCVYIGDALTDIQAANSANMISIAAGWGHLYATDMGCRITAHTPMQLCRALTANC